MFADATVMIICSYGITWKLNVTTDSRSLLTAKQKQMKWHINTSRKFLPSSKKRPKKIEWIFNRAPRLMSLFVLQTLLSCRNASTWISLLCGNVRWNVVIRGITEWIGRLLNWNQQEGFVSKCSTIRRSHLMNTVIDEQWISFRRSAELLRPLTSDRCSNRGEFPVWKL